MPKTNKRPSNDQQPQNNQYLVSNGTGALNLNEVAILLINDLIYKNSEVKKLSKENTNLKVENELLKKENEALKNKNKLIYEKISELASSFYTLLKMVAFNSAAPNNSGDNAILNNAPLNTAHNNSDNAVSPWSPSFLNYDFPSDDENMNTIEHLQEILTEKNPELEINQETLFSPINL